MITSPADTQVWYCSLKGLFERILRDFGYREDEMYFYYFSDIAYVRFFTTN